MILPVSTGSVASHSSENPRSFSPTFNRWSNSPFTHKYLAQFAFGNSDPESMAKAILYPRILGTSIATTFGNELQFFCNDVLSAFASTTSGIDIEYNDALSGRHTYCQVKTGPTTINANDVETIRNHFAAIKNLARTNRLKDFNPLYDCAIGIFFGDEKSLSGSYKSLRNDYTVLIGREFWEHLTGDPEFYNKLIAVFAEIADEMDCSKIIDEVIRKLASQLE
jgi:dihydrofolate reductase